MTAMTHNVSHPDSIAPHAHSAVSSRAARYTGRALSGLMVLALGMDCAIHLLHTRQAVEGTVALGFSENVLFPLGLIQLAALVMYVVPRTAALGALLWTGYLGGAVATHVRAGHPLLTHTLVPVFVATVLWAGLVLRDRRVRNVLPFTNL